MPLAASLLEGDDETTSGIWAAVIAAASVFRVAPMEAALPRSFNPAALIGIAIPTDVTNALSQ